ncbi:MAG: DNA polymerase III subunit beta [Chloroflexi bacterium]|nr:DNA polymerase III subunit beta [Chloroflexota bacterium]
MKLTCAQEHLAKGLSIVGRAVPSRSPMAILSNILLATDGGRLKLAATNLDIGITCWIEAQAEDEGAITIPARLLQEFVSSLPSGEVALTLKPDRLTAHLRCGASEANIKGVDAEEFPPIPRVDGQVTASVEREALHTAVHQVALAAATDETRPVLAGVLFRLRGGKLTLAAADGFRLAVRTVEVSAPVDTSYDVIVPARATVELARIVPDDAEMIDLTVTPNRSQVLFHTGDPATGRGGITAIELVSRLIEGTFPNYEQIIPARFATRVVATTKDFQNATRIASFFARDASNIVRIHAQPGEELTPGKLIVAATSADVGDAVSGIDAVIEGNDLQIAFNAKYLGDVLGVLNTAQLSLEMNTPASPGVIRPVGGDGYLYVIMPMHTQNAGR